MKKTLAWQMGVDTSNISHWINKGVEWVKSKGVRVDPAIGDVIEG
jgi:hypothetical protein